MVHDTESAVNITKVYTLISNFPLVLNVVFFILCDSPASEFYMPTFRDTFCSEAAARKIQTPGNHPKEGIKYPRKLGKTRKNRHKYLPSERGQVNEGDACVREVYKITRHQAIPKHSIKIICRIHQNC